MQSENPKDCRLIVQEINLDRSEINDKLAENVGVLETLLSKSEKEITDTEVSTHTRKSKWGQFLENNDSVTTLKDESNKINHTVLNILEPSDSKNCEKTFYEFEKRQKWDNLIAETEKCMETKIMTIEKVKCDQSIKNVPNKTSNLGDKLQISLTGTFFDDNRGDLDLEI